MAIIKLNEPEPLREKIASSIREAIIDGKINPGERLTEPGVAEMLGVSRTPLREAFLQLESEGLLKVTPRKGAIVTDISEADADETYSIRVALEALAGGFAAENISPSEIQQLIELNSKMEKISKAVKKDYKKFIDLNSQFHSVIYNASKKRKLINLIGILRAQTLRYNTLYHTLFSRLTNSVKEHSEIITALKKKDKNRTEQLLKKHGEKAKQTLIEYIRGKNK
jgi:DNA-binding GntR family transcriptional regulator